MRRRFKQLQRNKHTKSNQDFKHLTRKHHKFSNRLPYRGSLTLFCVMECKS